MQTSDNRHFGSTGYSIRSSQFGPSDPNNPYGASSTQQPPAKKSNTWLWILLGVGGVLILGCCGCFGAISFFGKGALDAGMGMVAEQIKPGLNADPVVQEHLGEIQEMSWDLMATGEASKGDGPDKVVWDVKGSKGEGQITGEMDQTGGAARLKNGVLRMKDGTEHILTP